MKWLSFLFALYLLAISLLPCRDICATSQVQTVASVEAGFHDHSADHQQDVCSPFCSCSCCQTPSAFNFPTFHINERKNDFFPVLTFSVQDIFYSSSYSGNIWQPPKTAV